MAAKVYIKSWLLLALFFFFVELDTSDSGLFCFLFALIFIFNRLEGLKLKTQTSVQDEAWKNWKIYLRDLQLIQPRRPIRRHRQDIGEDDSDGLALVPRVEARVPAAPVPVTLGDKASPGLLPFPLDFSPGPDSTSTPSQVDKTKTKTVPVRRVLFPDPSLPEIIAKFRQMTISKERPFLGRNTVTKPQLSSCGPYVIPTYGRLGRSSTSIQQ